MRIEQIRDIPGPNVYSSSPVLVMKLDLEDLAGKESYEVPGFIDRLLERLPGVHEHHCALGRPGGFVERLREGTWFGHIVEHVALELTDAAGISVNRGKTVEAGEPGKFLVAVTYKSEAGMRCLLRAAVELVDALIHDIDYPLDEKIEEAKRAVADTGLGPSTQALVDEAERRNIPWRRLDQNSLIQLGYGKNLKRIEATITSQTSAIGVDISSDKQLTKELLRAAGIPVPRGTVVESEDEALTAFHDLGERVVVKPLDGNQGKGVSLNVQTPDELRAAYAAALEHSDQIIVEEVYQGRDYRVMVVNGRMVAASEKVAARVIGDGEHTIQELIELANQDPQRGESHSMPLSRIVYDSVVEACLHKAGMALESVPEAGQEIPLRESANLSTGGEAHDVTDQVHPGIARLCERASRLIGLDVCGLDLIVPDISEPPQRGGIVEVNAAPGIRMHHFPSEGQSRNVAEAVIDMLFPDGANGRIPIISITGTNGKTTTTRMIGHVLQQNGIAVGMTTTDGISVSGESVASGDMTGPWSARVVLSDPLVEAAVLETARGGIVRNGLGYDWSDIAVLTNVQADHLGQDGIDSVEDILRIKAVVPRRVREGGTIVLNADDDNSMRLVTDPGLSSLPRQFVLFSMDPGNPHIAPHTADGGRAYVLRGDWIEEKDGSAERRIARASDIPVTRGGTAEFQIENVLACVAACRSYGLSPAEITSALATFDANEGNGGRLNIFRYRDSVVVVDYGHNPAALSAVSRMIARWQPNLRTAVLGLPGDRTEELIAEATAAAAGGFDRFIIREDKDLRGRRPGEVPELIESVLREETPQKDVHLIADEIEAVRFAMESCGPAEVVVCFCEKVEEVIQLISSLGGTLLSNSDELRMGVTDPAPVTT